MNVTRECYECHWIGGECQSDSKGNFNCSKAETGHQKLPLKLGLGILGDGREVAVKRLYEHNCRRVEQFMNEIKILTLLSHTNLVMLYGCTSCRSQGLLLVYEFIPNGTVADHLHGDRVNQCLLTWPIRINIAIETATALAFLHAFDIIHRDVKTNNILLDNKFYVKVADFGLSRLFPTDVTHVSTAPQGTPGYVDPEYHQSYQLTDKSDVYSFGVVLVELISSMPAVDMSRHTNEINLANLGINRIQKCAVDELIDPCLGSHSDEEVKRMATSVAELAFLCLQQSREMRPTMDEVLKELERIKNRECKPENLKEEDDDDKEELTSMQQPEPSTTHCEETALLKNIKLPPLPISVTETWVSNSTTSNGFRSSIAVQPGLARLTSFTPSTELFKIEETGFNQRCQPFACGDLGKITFPFSNETHPECGLLRVDNCNEPSSSEEDLVGERMVSFFNVIKISLRIILFYLKTRIFRKILLPTT
ncbi:hypothetical protein Dsin_028872 [Dipteronia sinensis]|uniref:Protein kinase domain-containing protein n=1 Tax=Dipteronia sinensis TaxID=43782 RepID=A0AAE0DUY7_9ROSI|nr:hypothetical protein Dsin_028872 [Dipteronia sinensis]